MKRLGLKNLTLNQVIHYYDDIIENTHFNYKESDIPDGLKELSIDDTGLLMALGTEGLHFIGNAVRSGFDGYELTQEELLDVYSNCDGFGKLSLSELMQINDGWDWSHIRDSSEETLKEVELKIKQLLIEKYNRK